MDHPAYVNLMNLAATPESLEASVEYLVQQLSFVKPKESVLICFTRNQPFEIGSLFEKAVLQRGGIPVFWEKDYRWKTLLRQAFSNRVTTVIGPPLVVLGLGKIARYKNTPLGVRNVITAGYPCADWMIAGIVKCFDCEANGCFTPGSRIVAGFSCSESQGVHIRDDVYGVEIVDSEGKPCADGELGDMVIYPKSDPSIRYPVGEQARLDKSPCACGCASARLVDMQAGQIYDLKLDSMTQELISWTSILDCRLRKGPYGLELELVVFPGEKLPKLPEAAKRVVRAWDPEKDEPFYYTPGIENT